MAAKRPGLTQALDLSTEVLGMRTVTLWLIALLAISLTPSAIASDGLLQGSLASAERSFSKSMVDRDFEAFSSHIAEDAIFINGGKPPAASE